MTSPKWMISLGRTASIQLCGRDLRGVNIAAEACWTENHFSIYWVLLFFHNPVEVVIDEHWLQVPENTIVIVPPHSHLTLRFLSRSVHHWFHFSCGAGRGDEVPIAALTRSGREMRRTFEAVVKAFKTDQRLAAERFHQILLDVQLKNRSCEVLRKQLHPKLQVVIQLIEHSLHRTLHAPDLAKKVSLSQRQLLNLFKQLTGGSIVGYIRQRRAERALHLIEWTNRPIRSIAVEVGISDLQLFNKTIRDFYGKSPRQLRAKGRLQKNGVL
jgi:AraC family transcriptional regulator